MKGIQTHTVYKGVTPLGKKKERKKKPEWDIQRHTYTHIHTVRLKKVVRKASIVFVRIGWL